MGNGAGILSDEVADDIKAIENLKPRKDCENLVGTLGRAVVRSLRLGEGACRVAKQNRILLALVLIVTVKGDIAWLVMKFVTLLK